MPKTRVHRQGCESAVYLGRPDTIRGTCYQRRWPINISATAVFLHIAEIATALKRAIFQGEV